MSYEKELRKKAIVIIPYFGKLPNYFNLWLKSASFNSDFDYLIFTDDDCSKYQIPSNVKIEKCLFEDIVKRIQNKLDFPIHLNKCYKLCDFKPSYGYIFEKEVEGYDFWAYGDIDLIYGNLSNFITKEICDSFEKILGVGHLCLIKNNKKMNEIFMKKIEGCYFYKDVFTSEDIYSFDEFGQNGIGGHYQICEKSGIKIYNKMFYADIMYSTNKLKCHFGGSQKEIKEEFKKKHVRFLFDNGKLVQLCKSNQSKGKEVAYVHLQKRKMKPNNITDNKFYIYPHYFDNKKRKFRFSFDEMGYQKNYLKGKIKSFLKKR